MEAQNGAVKGLWTIVRIRITLMRCTTRIRMRIKVKSRIRIRKHRFQQLYTTYYDKRFLLHGSPDGEMTVLACRHPVLLIQQLNTVWKYVGLNQNQCWAVLRIHDILGWIRIRILGSMPLTNGSGSCYIRHWPSKMSAKTNFWTIFSAYYFLKLQWAHKV